MSKHQTCEECKCDFIGPDRNVGDNLCEDCYVERHNPCLFAIEQLKEQLGTKQGEIERLQAVIQFCFVLNPDHDDTDIIGHELRPMPHAVRETIIDVLAAAQAAKEE